MNSPELFFDTAYAIALSVEDDVHHSHATVLSYELDDSRTRMVTTWAVLLEIGSALSKPRMRNSCAELLDALSSDERVDVVPLTHELMRHGRELFAARADKEWSLTDCISFVVMQERDLTEVLTTDAHFEQAGFKALRREN